MEDFDDIDEHDDDEYPGWGCTLFFLWGVLCVFAGWYAVDLFN